MNGFCESCDTYTTVNPRTGVCRHCARSTRNGDKIISGGIVGGIVGGPIGIIAGGILGGLFGEDDE